MYTFTESQITLIAMSISMVVVFGYMWSLLKIHGKKAISPLDLITDWKSGRLEFKKLALNTCALCQVFTWLRMSMGYEVNSALQNPMMWIVFYIVIAAQDLVEQLIHLRFGDAKNGSNKRPDDSEQS